MKKKKSEAKGSLLPSALADVELQHIERAVAQLRTMHNQSPGTLNVEYWRERLAAVVSGYALVPAQKQRIEALRLALDAVRTTPRDGGSRKRSTNRLWAKAALIAAFATRANGAIPIVARPARSRARAQACTIAFVCRTGFTGGLRHRSCSA
jgi:hypothetical protein